MMDKRERLTIFRIALVATLLLNIVAFYQILLPSYNSGILFASRRLLAVLSLGILGVLIEAGLLVASWTPFWETVVRWSNAAMHALQRLRWFNLVLFALSIGIFSYLLIGLPGLNFYGMPTPLFLFWLLTLLGSVLLKAAGLQRGWAVALAAAFLVAGVGYRIAVFTLDISTYPFSLGWSEASRYYYASLYFAKNLYGFSVPPTVLHPSRYLLQSIPFLIPNSPLWLHRLWQVGLWIAITLTTAYFLARRLSVADRLKRWLFIGWTFLFMLLGPVYYHLQVPVIIILWGFDRNKFWKSLAIILLASAWAGISRINWFPVPAMLAATLYFLEEPAVLQPLWRYLARPLVWGVAGTAAAFGVQKAYIAWSGNPPGLFSSSFSSDLLWYRLFPNPTYPLGILLSALLVSLPLLLIIFGRMAGHWKAYHPIRLLGLAAIMLVLFVVGVIVSTKIGGGNNLHNLDSYLCFLVIIAAYFYFGKTVEDWPLEQAVPSPRWATHWAVIVLALAIPMYYTLILGGPRSLPSPGQTAQDIDTLTKNVNKYSGQNGEVLFIAERELVTFNTIPGVKLVPDYERVFLMEMAMAGNPDYLNKFHDELKNHRFAMIVSEPLFVQYKGSDEIFGEENNAWVSQVSKYVFCYYEPQKMLRNSRIQLLVPRSDTKDCP
jgi:hypothetical protein